MKEIAKLTAKQDVSVILPNGDKATVTVHALPLSKMDQWLAAQEDESKMIQIATGLKPEDVEGITRESQEELVRVAEEMNASFFERFVARRVRRAQKLQGYADAAKSPSE